MKVSDIKNCTARGVVIACFDGDKTYNELSDSLGIKLRAVMDAVSYLRTQGWAQIVYIPGDRRAHVRVTLPMTHVINSPMDMCKAADETEDRDEQRAALRAVWSDIFPKEKFPNAVLVDRNANELLRMVGYSAVEVCLGLGNIKYVEKHIKHPFEYAKQTLAKYAREPKVVNATPHDTTATPTATQFYYEEEEVDMDLMAQYAEAWKAQQAREAQNSRA